VLSLWRVAPFAGVTITSDRSWATAEAWVVVVVVDAAAWPWMVGVASPTCLPGPLAAEKPPTTATVKRAPTTAMPTTNIAVPLALKPSWRLRGRRLTVLPTSSRLEANGPLVAA
jgi:hypothetical protein